MEFVNYWIYKYCRGNEEQSVYLPTMVERYDHHERVMKSVLNYENEYSMTEAQHQYYDAILKRLLYTHYALCLVYDKNQMRGFERGRSFDHFLNMTHPDLARWIGSEMKIVRIARRYHFNPDRMNQSIMLFFFQKIEKCKGKILHSHFLKRLAYNSVTLRISKMSVFETSYGKLWKKKVKKIFEKI